MENLRLKDIISTNKWFILAVASLILGFIWFGIRPAYTRNYCQDKAREAGVGWWNLEFTFALENLKKSQLQTEYTEDFYIRCLHDKGLDK